MSEAGNVAEPIKEEARDMASKFESDSQLAEEAGPRLRGIDERVVEMSRLLSQVIAIRTEVAAMLTAEGESKKGLKAGVAEHTRLATNLSGFAKDLLDTSQNPYTASALAHLDNATNEAQEGVDACDIVLGEVGEALSQVDELRRALGTAAGLIVFLKGKTVVIANANAGLVDTAANTSTHLRGAVEDLESYQDNV